MKKWIKINFQKIALSFAVMTGGISLALGAISYHKTTDLTYFLNPNYTVTWGGNYMVRKNKW